MRNTQFFRLQNNGSSNEFTEISREGAFSISIENESTYTAYVETDKQKTYSCPIKTGEGRSWSTGENSPYTGKFYIHFADASQGVQEGSVSVFIDI